MNEFGCCRVSSRAAVCCVQSIFNSLTRPNIDTHHRAAAEVAQKGCGEVVCASGRHRGAFPTHRDIHQIERSVCCKEACTGLVGHESPVRLGVFSRASFAIQSRH
eukprot:scaffold93537_cov43-Phaeocystis_antarctica.AAC.1